jgi:antitoxin component of MazEF toxin-antitoxin module
MVHLKKGNLPDSMFNKKQLKIGMKVETEHSNDPKITKQIAKAHLTENPEYYKYLDKMEKCMSKHTGK